MAKFLITLHLKNNLQMIVEETDVSAATERAYNEANNTKQELVGVGWKESLTVEVWDVELVKP